VSSAFTRALRKLYPRQVRDRYGDELLDLQDELRARGEISRTGLLRDAIVGAMLTRSRRQRASLTLTLMSVVAGLAFATSMITAATGPKPNRTPAAPWEVSIAKATSSPQLTPSTAGHSCPVVSDGSSCSLPACTEYVEMNPQTGNIVASTAEAAANDPARTKCAASRITRPTVLPVSN
jgi:hypothetical protein